MKVIFLQDVDKVGKKYEVKDMPNGYVRNFLLPKKLVEVSTPKKEKEIEKKRAIYEKKESEKIENLAKSLEKLSKTKISIKRKVNEEGGLFAGIQKEDIIMAVKDQAGKEIEAEFLQLSDPIKEVGEFNVKIKIGDVESKIHLVVEAEE